MTMLVVIHHKQYFTYNFVNICSMSRSNFTCLPLMVHYFIKLTNKENLHKITTYTVTLQKITWTSVAYFFTTYYYTVFRDHTLWEGNSIYTSSPCMHHTIITNSIKLAFVIHSFLKHGKVCSKQSDYSKEKKRKKKPLLGYQLHQVV